MKKQSTKKTKLKPGALIKAFDFTVDKKDYIRSMALSNDEKLLFVAFNWNANIRVFNIATKREESNNIEIPINMIRGNERTQIRSLLHHTELLQQILV
jgi:hypothetical protein